MSDLEEANNLTDEEDIDSSEIEYNIGGLLTYPQQEEEEDGPEEYDDSEEFYVDEVGVNDYATYSPEEALDETSPEIIQQAPPDPGSVEYDTARILEPGEGLQPSDTASDLLPVQFDDFRGMSVSVPLQDLPLRKSLKASANMEKVPPSQPTDENLLQTFKIGDEKVYLRDFRGLRPSMDISEELGEDDDLSKGWNVNLLDSFLSQKIKEEEPLELDEMNMPSIMKIPEPPAREALSKAAASLDDAMDPIIRHLEISANQEPHETDTTPVLYRCPSVMSALKPPKAEVFIYLFPEYRMISRECRLDVTIYQIKEAISRYIKVPPEMLELKRRKHVCHDERSLLDLGAKPNGRILLRVEVNKRLAFSENRNALQRMEDYYKPKVVELKPDTIRRVNCMVKDESGKLIRKSILVTIVYPTEVKPMIGGYYDKKANVTYHHAATSPEPEPQSIICTSNEACQTHSEKHLWTQTNMEKANQTVRPDLFLSDAGDRVLCARHYYISAAEMNAKRKWAAIIIQKYWRRWLAIRERQRRVIELVRQVEWIENIRKERVELRENLIREELERQINPKSLLDLELLYRAINKWRKEQTEFIYANRWGVERKAALAQIAEMEADLLQQLDKVRNRIIENNDDKYKQKKFLKMGQPKRWLGYKSLFVSLDTQGRVLARYLHSLYKSLVMPVVNTPEGLQNRLILLEEITEQVRKGEKAIKSTSKMPRHLIDMIHDLIGREMRFISIKCSPGLIAATRKRDPIFNPEAKRCDPIPYDRQKLGQMVSCKMCLRMLPRDSFAIIKGTTVTPNCNSCTGLYRTAILRSELNLFRHILKQLRESEFRAGVVNSVTSLLDANDMKFLFEQIWGSQSALSGIDNRYLLTLCRWKKEEPWAPWNCVLFTDEEAAIHLELESFEQAYQPTFLHKIAVQHARARLYFSDLAKFSMKMDYEMAKLSCSDVVVPTTQDEPEFSSQRTKKLKKRSRRT